MKTLTAPLLCALSFFATSSKAQIQGQRGTTSTGEVQLSLSVDDFTAAGEVRLSGLQNGYFGAIPKNSTGALVQYNRDVCLWHTSPTFRLTVSRVSKPEKGLGLMIISQNGDTIPILTRYGYGANRTTMADGVALTSQTALHGAEYSDTCTHNATGAYVPGGTIEYFINNETGRLPANTVPGTYVATFRWTMAAE